MKTATPAHRAATTQTTPETREVTLPDQFGQKLAELADLKHARTEIEKKEKALKAEIMAAVPARTEGLKKTVLRIGGVIRASVSHSTRESNDRKALAEAFPEAYSATLTETEINSLNLP